MKTTCWNCIQALDDDALTCTGCDVLQPLPRDSDYFDVLEVPRTFNLDPKQLEKSFKRHSRKVHPDRFATASPRERLLSLEHATAVNDAYRTLKAPLNRGEYLLGRWGHPTGDAAKARLPFEFLEQVMELREQISDARHQHEPGALNGSLQAAEEMWRDCYRATESLFLQCERSQSKEERQRLLDQVEQSVQKLRYLQGILTDAGVTPRPPSVSNQSSAGSETN